MKFIPTAIADVILIEPRIFGDERGFFFESWNEKLFSDVGLDVKFVQDNHSKSAQGILRGMHYQMKQTQGKLVRVCAGEVFDVAVDMRKSSPTFGKWVGEYLSAQNQRMMWIPPGFAHGFYVTSESAEFLYKCTDLYAPEHEVSMRWDDPEVGIEWPLHHSEMPRLSAKDEVGLWFADAPKFD